MYSSIWKDPVAWSRGVAGSRARLVLFVIVHLMFAAFGLGVVYYFIGLAEQGLVANSLSRMVIVFVCGLPMLFIGVGFPALYLYAIYRLLQNIEAKKATSPLSPTPARGDAGERC
jgi:hypothetical protein